MRRSRRKRPVQLDLLRRDKKKRGGRPRYLQRTPVRHRTREKFRSKRAVHVTMRMASHVWSLRSTRSRRVMEHAVRGGRSRFGIRIVQLAVMGDHVHLLVEAPDHVALARAMKGLSVRIGLHMNRLMKSSGRVMGDRYHVRLLESPRQVKNAVHYIRNNFRKHEQQQGRQLPEAFVDPYSSDGVFAVVVLPAEHFLIRKATGS